MCQRSYCRAARRLSKRRMPGSWSRQQLPALLADRHYRWIVTTRPIRHDDDPLSVAASGSCIRSNELLAQRIAFLLDAEADPAT